MEQNQLHEYVSCSIEKWASFHTHHFKTCRTWNESLPMFIKQLVSVIVLSNLFYASLLIVVFKWIWNLLICNDTKMRFIVLIFMLHASIWMQTQYDHLWTINHFFDDGIILTYVVSSHFQVIKFLFQCQI